MELAEFKALLLESLSANKTLSAFIRCEVQYSGRAETYLPEGDRLLLVKSDNSVHLHQPQGSNPINYMKSGSIISAELDEDVLSVAIENVKEKAWLEISVSFVYDAISMKLEDGRALDLAGNEKDMSDWIRDNPHCISGEFRPIRREEQTDVGFIDVYGHDGDGIVVVECKRVTASLAAVDQLRRYVERVKNLKGTDGVRGILVAPSITSNAKDMLLGFGLEFCRVDPPKRLERWLKDQKSIFDY